MKKQGFTPTPKKAPLFKVGMKREVKILPQESPVLQNGVRGFTLIEILIASLISALVILSIYSVFHTGSLSYKRIDAALGIYQEARVIFNRLEIDLKNAFAYGENDAKFTGDAQSLGFISILDAFRQEGGVYSKVCRIKYDFSEGTLKRSYREGIEIFNDENEEIGEHLASDLQEISFQYAAYNKDNPDQPYTWQDLWPKKENEEDLQQQKSYPLAVKIELKLKNISFTKLIPLSLTFSTDEK